jgi:hypothetical protein
MLDLYEFDDLVVIDEFKEYEDYKVNRAQSVCNYDETWSEFRSDVYPNGWENPKFKPWFRKVWYGWDAMLILNIGEYSVSIFKDGVDKLAARTFKNINAAMFHAFAMIQSRVNQTASEKEAFKVWYMANKPKYADIN